MINTTYAGEPCANVLHYHQTLADHSYTSGPLAEALADKWVDNIAPIVPETVQLVSVTVSDLHATPTAPGQNATGSGTSGGNTNAQLPNHVTPCITLRTALGGRSGRGRLYHVGMCNTHAIMNVIDPGFVADLLTAYGQFITVSDSTGQQFKWSVVSYFGGGNQRGTPLVSIVTSVSCDSTVDSMRKRIPGH